MKRGQVTIFVVLGIVIVSLVAIGYAFKDELSARASDLGLVKTATLPPQFEEKKEEVENCLNEILALAVQEASLQGGYAEKHSEESYAIGEFSVPYYFDKGTDKTPTKKTIENEIAKLVKKDAVKCVSVIGLEEPKKSTVDIEIKDTKINANVKMQVPLTINGVTETLNNFEANTNIRAGKILDAISSIVKQQVNDPDNLCLTCINQAAFENDLEMEIESTNEEVIITVIDENSLINEEPLKFIFAMRY